MGRRSRAKRANLCLLAFRPAGWDNEKKIAILHENFTTVKPEDAYEDFIVKPPVRKVPHSVPCRPYVGEVMKMRPAVPGVAQEGLTV